jgi:uncharacterized protein with PIN domain
LCGWFDENAKEPPKQCPDCGCSVIREATKETLDRVNPDAVSHFKKEVKQCWNHDVNPISGARSYHDLDLMCDIDTRNAGPNVDPETGIIIVRQRCKYCKEIYGQQFIPVTRVDEFERLGILGEVRAFLPKSVLESA